MPALAAVERATQAGQAAVGFVAYEAAHAFDHAFPEARTPVPLVWFALLDLVPFHAAPYGEPSSALPPRSSPPQTPEGEDWSPTVARSAYRRALQRIRAYIEAGDVYQVNYSFRLRAPFEGDPLALFWRLYYVQPTPYAAYIDTGEHVFLSLSPELFFRLNGEHIVSRPMKGTAPRGLTMEDDWRQAQALRSSEKNRAENLMIVDMVRNDLGRIAKTGSVHAPRLFETERYATLWQMTSTVEAQTNASLVEIFRALFPAASITGAPKIRATQIIHELETTPRGVYTGTIGVVLPHRQAQFNVAIRTLHYHRTAGRLEYGVGSGVVWDSATRAEYEECFTKAQTILHPRPAFELLETMLWSARRGYFLLEPHLQRLLRSAEYFGFEVNAEEVRSQLAEFAHQLRISQLAEAAPAPARRFRVRLLVDRDGATRLEAMLLEPRPRVWRVKLAPEPVDPSDVFLYHKTTYRRVYEAARAACPDCEDVILWNPRGEVTESTIANLVVELNGQLYTPPVSSGLLGGVYRGRLLERGRLKERVILVDELRHADAVYLINSVRGWVRARVLPHKV